MTSPIQHSVIKTFIEKHFGIVLLISCAAGLVIRPLAEVPDVSVVVALAILMFISCYRLRDGGFATLRWRDIALYYVARFLILPGVLFALVRVIAPDYAVGVFLLTTLPSAVSSPAFVSMFGGTIAPSFAIVIISQLLTPIVIPLQFALIGSVAATPSPAALFTTMAWCVFLPMGLYMLTRKHHRSAAYIYSQNKFWSVLLVAYVIAAAIAKQREVILSGHGVLPSLVIALLCFALYLAFGYFLLPKRPRGERITYTVCSGFNNAALGVSLALLHFKAQVLLFVAISEMGWSLLPMMLGFFLRTFARQRVG